MRNGPETRYTGTVTTINANTSVVITQDRGDSEDINTQSAARTVTLTEATTAGWRSGERIEVIVKSLGG